MRRALLLLVFLAACDDAREAAAPPPPMRLDADAVTEFCQMSVSEHDGPKGQIFLEGFDGPLWFGQVRDAIAFVKSPEKLAEHSAIYVSDMARAPSWEAPGDDNWIAAADAWFVVGGSKRGGMGAPEVAPFGDRAAADAFAAAHGGAVMRLDDIPVEAVLGAVDIDNEGEGES